MLPVTGPPPFVVTDQHSAAPIGFPVARFPVVGGVKNGDGLSFGEGILRSGLKNSECNDDKTVIMRVGLCGCFVEEEDEVKEGEGGSHVEETRQERRKESETQTVAGCLLVVWWVH
ncbi:hypothetical protein WN944_000079 [Citrus x changshan-huyou]|uniref:Uncharacterized protein n=1 Tax=Citrus x changshan-huyou TaxID=2935761 RepID=A0AAP0QTG6_9ROSI